VERNVLNSIKEHPYFIRKEVGEGYELFIFEKEGRTYEISYNKENRRYYWFSTINMEVKPAWFRRLLSEVNIENLKKNRMKDVLRGNGADEKEQLLKYFLLREADGIDLIREYKAGSGFSSEVLPLLEEYQREAASLGYKVEIIEKNERLCVR
jgi:hypothetical protein